MTNTTKNIVTELNIDIIITNLEGEQEWIPTTLPVELLVAHCIKGSTTLEAMEACIYYSARYVDYMLDYGDEDFGDCYMIDVYRSGTTQLVLQTSTEI